MHCNKLCFNILFVENENIFNHVCTNDFVPNCKLSDRKYLFGKLSSINILKKNHLRQYIWYYYTFFKNKTTEFGSNYYICPEGLYDKVLCIFSIGVFFRMANYHVFRIWDYNQPVSHWRPSLYYLRVVLAFSRPPTYLPL